MSHEGLASVARSIDDVKHLLVTLSDEEWALPSGCEGWTVRDLVAHMSSNYKETVEPSPPPEEPVDLPAERVMDLLVEARADWSNRQVRDEYLQYCDDALDALTAMQEEPLASTVVPLADLGRYPLNQLADAYAFDHYCHLHIDLLAPRGPLDRRTPPVDDALLGPAVGWMLTGLPQMQPGLERHLPGTVRLELTGPGSGSWDVGLEGDRIIVRESDPASRPDATVRSSAHDFVLWGTVRAPWRHHCRVSGDEQVASTFLDALNIV